MEHNIEKNIRLKVNEAEQYPVRWNKDDVWARMEMHPTTRSRRPVYFSIAASLAIGILAAVYSYQRVTDIPDTMPATAKTESAQPSKTNTLRAVNDDIPVTMENAASGSTIVQNTARIRIEEESYTPAVAPQATPNDTMAIQEANPQTNTLPVMQESIPVEVAPDKRPKVIIGIIPPQEQRLITHQEKKKKFKLLKGKSQDEGTEGNQLIIARIN